MIIGEIKVSDKPVRLTIVNCEGFTTKAFRTLYYWLLSEPKGVSVTICGDRDRIFPPLLELIELEEANCDVAIAIKLLT